MSNVLGLMNLGLEHMYKICTLPMSEMTGCSKPKHSVISKCRSWHYDAEPKGNCYPLISVVIGISIFRRSYHG